MEDFEKWESLLLKLMPQKAILEEIEKKTEKPRYAYIVIISMGVFLMFLPIIVYALIHCCNLCESITEGPCKVAFFVFLMVWFGFVATMTYYICSKWINSPIINVWLERHYKFSEFVFSQVSESYRRELDISARRSTEWTYTVNELDKKICTMEQNCKHELKELGNAIDKMEIGLYRKWIEQNVKEWKTANMELKDKIDKMYDSCHSEMDEVKKQLKKLHR